MAIFSTNIVGVALIVGKHSGHIAETIKCQEIGREAGFQIADAGAAAVVFADPSGALAEECSKYLKDTVPAKEGQEYQTTSYTIDDKSKESIQAVVTAVIEAYGRLDYVVNTIGISQDPNGGVQNEGMINCCDVEAAAMSRQTDSQYWGKPAKRNIGRGVIVNVTPPNPGALFHDYKLVGMDVTTRTALREGVRCNLVSVDWFENKWCNQDLSSNEQNSIEENLPFKRPADLVEVGGTIAFLVSPAASYLNANCLVLDGGPQKTRNGGPLQ
ncbi:NAD(P)-binding protein [Aspergillus sclerotioniger CBS 115572]|uniref:3-oxoacyl-[acyl-carrier-protein] reductase n=1 Tax=Aspergillus sclerotioniger CBS 115572 TaxID=1450535 RepID=A0A317VCJ9_9EURO|nr:NAD(P)-binding protein [Aspergillus sclerotioniger CBS 115572]PWY69610.1 NAD(P)-binding protein [Aspergillus sclerotioniger CBS 115572]